MLRIHIQINTLEMGPSGMITGVIALRDEKHSFPDNDWNDFPVVVLGWWLEELTRLRSGQAVSAQCLFMDGPFLFDVTRHGDEANVRCLRRTQQTEQVVHEGHVPFDVLMRDVMASASKIAATCDERGWKSSDLTRLKNLIKAIESKDSNT